MKRAGRISIDSRLGVGQLRLLTILERLFPLRFEVEVGNPNPLSSVGLTTEYFGATASFSAPNSSETCDRFGYVFTKVNFTEHASVPFPFRGRALRVKMPREIKALSPSPGENVIATVDQGPIWVCSGSDARHYRVALPIPSALTTSCFQDLFNGESFVELLPLVHWIRQLFERRFVVRLRACFVFDDPNLHWITYGRIDYRQMALHAAEENYHVCLATVPLDAWFVHKRTAALFQNSQSHLSLAVHGNDHTKQELAGKYTQTKRLNLLSQARNRIARLERQAGLSVDRIMIPPHGACSQEMLSDLPRCGFDGACISHGSLRAHNASSSWTETLGYYPCEVVNDCPVLPRWAFSPEPLNIVLLAAYLNQAIIFRGHQNDLKQGIELLDRHAEVINSLGNVAWCSPGQLARIAYESVADGHTLEVRLWSRAVFLRIPENIKRVRIIHPFNDLARVHLDGREVEITSGVELDLLPGEVATLKITVAAPQFFSENGPRLPSPRAVLRRFLAECRDRICR